MDNHRCLVQATVVGVNDASVLYPACIQCYAKMLHNLQTDLWQCMRCNVRRPASNLSWRYRLSLCVADMSACCNLSLFGGTLVQHFGCSANQFHQFLHTIDENNSAVKEETILQALQTSLIGNRYIFCLKTSVLPQRSHLGPPISQDAQPTSLRLMDLLNAQPSSSNSKMCDFIAVQMISTGIVSGSQTSTILSVLNKLIVISKSEQDSSVCIRRSLCQQGGNVDEKSSSQSCNLRVCLSEKGNDVDNNRNLSHRQGTSMTADCSGCSDDNVLCREGSCECTNTMHIGCISEHHPNLSLDLSGDDTFYQNSGTSQPMQMFSCQSSMEREFPSSINSQSGLEQDFKINRNSQNTTEKEFQSNKNSQMAADREFPSNVDNMGSMEQEFPASEQGTANDGNKLRNHFTSPANDNNSIQVDDETVVDDQSTSDCSQSKRKVSCETEGEKIVQGDCDRNECPTQDQNHSFSSSLNESSLLLAAFDMHQQHDNDLDGHLGSDLDNDFDSSCDSHLSNDLNFDTHNKSDLDCDTALNDKCNDFTSQQQPVTKNVTKDKTHLGQKRENAPKASVSVDSDVCCGELGEGLNTKRTVPDRRLIKDSAVDTLVSVSEVLDMPYSEDLSLFLDVMADDQPIEAHLSPHRGQTMLVCEAQINLGQKSNGDPCGNKLDRGIERSESEKQIEKNKEDRPTERNIQDMIIKRNEQCKQLEKKKEANTDLSPQDLFEDTTVSASMLDEVLSSQQIFSNPDVENNSLNWSPCILDKFDCDCYSDKDVCRDGVSLTSGYHWNKCPLSDKSHDVSSSCHQLSNKNPCNSCPRHLFSRPQSRNVPHYVEHQKNLSTSSQTWNSSSHKRYDKSSLSAVNTSDPFPSVLPDSEDLDDFLNNLSDDKEIPSLAPQCVTKSVHHKENKEKQCPVASDTISHSHQTADARITNKEMGYGRIRLLCENVNSKKFVQEMCDSSNEQVTGSEHGPAWQDVDDFDGSAELFSQSTDDDNSGSCITPPPTSFCDKVSIVVEQHESLKTVEDSHSPIDTSCISDETDHSSSFNLLGKTSLHKSCRMSSKTRKVRFSRKRRVSSVRDIDCRLERYYSPHPEVVLHSNQKTIPPTPQRSCFKHRLMRRSLQGKVLGKNNVTCSQSPEVRSPVLARESAVRAKHLSHISYKTPRFSTPVTRTSAILPSPSPVQGQKKI